MLLKKKEIFAMAMSISFFLRAKPARAVVKLDIESEEHPFYQFYQVLSTSGGPYQARVAR